MMGTVKLLKSKQIEALGKVFEAEISGRPPFQSRAKVYADLESAGYVAKMERVFGAGERFPVTVYGYQLTHLGRLSYCSTCQDSY